MLKPCNEKLIKALLAIALLAVIALPVYNIMFIYPSFKKELLQNTEDEAIRVAAHLSSMFTHEVTVLTKEILPHDLPQMAEEVKRDFKLWKLKIFSASGEIIYSTDPKDIGEINKHKYFYEIVAKGNTHSVIVRKDKLTLEGQKVIADVAEIYIPIMRDGRFIGAFEIYYDITTRQQRFDALLRYYSCILFFVGIISIALIIFLFKANKELIAAKEKDYETKAFLDSILRSSIDMAIAATDTDFRIIYFNNTAEKFTGYTASDVIGRTVMQMHTKENVEYERFEKAIENVKTKGEHKYIIQQKRDDGIHYISSRVSGIFDSEGKLLGYLWLAIDITESIEAENILKRSYEDLSAKNKELERFHKLTVDREMQMIKLKNEVNELLQKSGQPKKYETYENNI